MENYEQKYKEAIERAKNYCNGHHTDVSPKAMSEYLFPELRESKDDRIKRCIQVALTDVDEKRFNDYGTTLKDCLAWLEKQESEPNWCHHKVDLSNCSEEYRKAYYDGWNNCNQQHAQLEAEQKTTDKVEPKFKPGDWIVNKDGSPFFCGETALQITHIDGDEIWFESKTWTTAERIRMWTIQDAKDGDVLYCESGGIEYIVMSKGVNEHGHIDSYFRYNSLDGFAIDIPSVFSAEKDGITPATKEQRDLLFQKMKEAGYEWNAEKKELTKIEQKSAEWSEEDKKKLNSIIDELKSYLEKTPKEQVEKDWKEIQDWYAQHFTDEKHNEEEELTEFENTMVSFAHAMFDHLLDVTKEVNVKEWKDKLIDLARKELQPEFDEELEKAYKTQDDVVYRNGYAQGKQDALKAALESLPKWKKSDRYIECRVDDFFFTLEDNGEMSPYYSTEIEEGQYYISKRDLLNLPKEE